MTARKREASARPIVKLIQRTRADDVSEVAAGDDLHHFAEAPPRPQILHFRCDDAEIPPTDTIRARARSAGIASQARQLRALEEVGDGELELVAQTRERERRARAAVGHCEHAQRHAIVLRVAFALAASIVPIYAFKKQAPAPSKSASEANSGQ